MIFVDTNVLMYAVGAPHPLQGAAREFLDESTRLHTPLCTSAEVLQELSHAYLSAGRVPALEAAMTLVARAGVEVWPLDEADVTLAQQLHVQHPGLSARGSLPPRELSPARRRSDHDLRPGACRSRPRRAAIPVASGAGQPAPSGRF